MMMRVFHKYYALFLSPDNHQDVSTGTEYDSAKRGVCRHKCIILNLLLNKSKIFE